MKIAIGIVLALILIALLLPCLSWGNVKVLKNSTNIIETHLKLAAPTACLGTSTQDSAAGTTASPSQIILVAFANISDSIGHGMVLDSFIYAVYQVTGTGNWDIYYHSKPINRDSCNWNYWNHAQLSDSASFDWGAKGSLKPGVGENTTDGAASADFDSTTSLKLVSNQGAPTNGVYLEFNLTAAAQYFYDSTGTGTGNTHHTNYGIEIRPNSAITNRSLIIGSAKNSDPTKQSFVRLVFHPASIKTQARWFTGVMDGMIDQANATTNDNSIKSTPFDTVTIGDAHNHLRKIIYGARGFADSVRAWVGAASDSIDTAYLILHDSSMSISGGDGNVYPFARFLYKPSWYEDKVTWNCWYTTDSAWGTAGALNLTTSSSGQNRTAGSGYDYTTYGDSALGFLPYPVTTADSGKADSIDIRLWAQNVMDSVWSDSMFLELGLTQTGGYASINFGSNTGNGGTSGQPYSRPYISVKAHQKTITATTPNARRRRLLGNFLYGDPPEKFCHLKREEWENY